MLYEESLETAKMSVIDIFVVSNFYVRQKSRSIGFFAVSMPVSTGMILIIELIAIQYFDFVSKRAKLKIYLLKKKDYLSQSLTPPLSKHAFRELVQVPSIHITRYPLHFDFGLYKAGVGVVLNF
jgi:hypothetical protein